jgi:uncharacterized protein YbjQ (UPF0145 family)
MTEETTLDLSLRYDMSVDSVPASGLAATAGFRTNDVLLEIQGQPIKSGAEIRRILDSLTATDSVSFGIKRGRQNMTLGPVPLSSSLNLAGANARVAENASASKQYSSLGVRHGDSAIPLTTGPSIPGRATSKVLGLVFGAGNAAWTIEGTSGKAGTALDKASQSLVKEARALGADAVVSIAFSMDGSGNSLNRSQTITLLGTAVRLEAAPEPPSGAGRHASGPEN